MTRDGLLAWMRRHTPDVPQCAVCAGSSGHPPISDDGALVCLPCVYRIGRLVADPVNCDVSVVSVAWEDHKDVVELRSCAAHTIEWQWLGWTADRDTLADPDGALLAFAAAMVVARRAEATGGRL